MKEASGELSLTVIVIVAIGAVAAIFWMFFPGLKDSIQSGFECATTGNTTVSGKTCEGPTSS